MPLGPLEQRVLEALWAKKEAVCVRELQPDFAGIAYTTLMTTLDRLHRKGLLEREKRGRAFFYRPIVERSGVESALVRDALRDALRDTSKLQPLLSFFVDAVSARDKALLDELDSLIQARRLRP